MYRIANRRKTRQRRRIRFGLLLAVPFVAIAGFVLFIFLRSLHQKPQIVNAKPHIIKVSYGGKTKRYHEPDFSIDIPVAWQLMPTPPHTYNSFTWSTTEKADNISIEVFEDTIPVNLAVNRALIVSNDSNRISLSGQASDNCGLFTAPSAAVSPGRTGVIAQWQGVNFICNRSGTTVDRIGTSSAEGINTVSFRKSDGTLHKFFFLFSNNEVSADYTAFYNSLTSFSMN